MGYLRTTRITRITGTMNKWADKRFIPAGLVKNGELVTGI